MPRGGKRAGAGRKATGRNYVQYTVDITPAQLAVLKLTAEQQATTVSALVRDALDLWQVVDATHQKRRTKP